MPDRSPPLSACHVIERRLRWLPGYAIAGITQARHNTGLWTHRWLNCTCPSRLPPASKTEMRRLRDSLSLAEHMCPVRTHGDRGPRSVDPSHLMGTRPTIEDT